MQHISFSNQIIFFSKFKLLSNNIFDPAKEFRLLNMPNIQVTLLNKRTMADFLGGQQLKYTIQNKKVVELFNQNIDQILALLIERNRFIASY